LVGYQNSPEDVFLTFLFPGSETPFPGQEIRIKMREIMENPERKKWVHDFLLKGKRGNGKSIFCSCLIIFILLGTLGAGSLKKGSNEMEVTGKVYVMGNEPFTHVAIRMDDGQVVALVGEHEKELRRLQGRRVLATGRPSEEKTRGAKAIEVKSFRVLEEK
jgi:hypothetical protein